MLLPLPQTPRVELPHCSAGERIIPPLWTLRLSIEFLVFYLNDNELLRCANVEFNGLPSMFKRKTGTNYFQFLVTLFGNGVSK